MKTLLATGEEPEFDYDREASIYARKYGAAKDSLHRDMSSVAGVMSDRMKSNLQSFIRMVTNLAIKRVESE